MANTATLDISLTIQDGANIGLGTYTGNPKIAVEIGLTSAQSAKRWTAQVTSAAATTYDVTTGLVNAFGVPLVFATVNMVVIYNTGAANLVVGGGSNPLFGADQYTVQAGQALAIPNVPITVSGTVKAITLTPAASTTWQIAILGA